MTNPLVRLGRLGQSPWYDFITRDLIASGTLAALIANDGLLGMTSNPTIFEKAISGSKDYDADVRRFMAEGLSPAAVFESLAVADVRAACDAFLPVYLSTEGRDGLVSLEVSPTLAQDAAGTVAEAKRLWVALDRPNAMIKIPGTVACLPAITECIAAGINVNITLLFSVERYQAVIDAYLTGLETRINAGLAINKIASVASFFVSRVDSRVDGLLDQQGNGQQLRSTIAIANAALAYQAFRTSLATPRWQRLAAHSATRQRPLWASTSTKDPRLPDVYYVEALIAEDTVNTLPPDTFNAYRDHGDPAVRIDAAIATAADRLGQLAAQNVSLADVTAYLEEDGLAKFAASYQAAVDGLAGKMASLAAA